MNYSKEAKSLTFRRGSEVSQVTGFTGLSVSGPSGSTSRISFKPSNCTTVHMGLGSRG